MARENKRTTLKDIYFNFYTNEVDPDSEYFLDYKEFRNAVETLLTLHVMYVVNTGKKIHFPHGMGLLYIKRLKDYENKHKKIDFGLTKKLGVTVYHRNKHSNGYYGRFKWDKSKHYIRNKQLFKFKPSRAAARYLAKQIKEKNTIVRYGL